VASRVHKFLLVPDSGPTDIRRLLMMAVLIVFTCSCSSTVTKPEHAATIQTPSSQPSPNAQPKAQDGQEPEIVRVERVINGPHQVKVVLVGNKNGQYSLSCDSDAEGCVTPTPGVDYYVITKDTNWRLEGATEPMTLKFIQDFTVSYNKAENIGLVAVDVNKRGRVAIYWLNSWTGK